MKAAMSLKANVFQSRFYCCSNFYHFGFVYRRIKKKAFNALRNFPKFIREEREREKRRSEMRKKVAYMLPDFEGSRSARSSITSSIGDPWQNYFFLIYLITSCFYYVFPVTCAFVPTSHPYAFYQLSKSKANTMQIVIVVHCATSSC